MPRMTLYIRKGIQQQVRFEIHAQFLWPESTQYYYKSVITISTTILGLAVILYTNDFLKVNGLTLIYLTPLFFVYLRLFQLLTIFLPICFYMLKKMCLISNLCYQSVLNLCFYAVGEQESVKLCRVWPQYIMKLTSEQANKIIRVLFTFDLLPHLFSVFH